ncbi:adenosine receptor A1-like [Littorina saxatilis]|uniref:G-protein coupled receptors family 1 profile domain-containing protein n=1 Tax=Littorina saxatilis TaxID=31220 RepID=A0AAN9AIS0_9CAEN
MDTTMDNSSQLNFPMPSSYLTKPPNIKDVATHVHDDLFRWRLRAYTFVAMEFVVGLLVIIINVLILLVMIRYRSFRTHTNAYIASLVVADLLVGLLVPPFSTLTHIHFRVDFVPCVIMVNLPCIFIDISVFNLVALACDRYFAVQYPLFHRRMVTTKRTMVCIAVSWLIGTIPSLTGLFFLKDIEDYKVRGYCSFGKVNKLNYNVYIYFFGFFIPVFVAMFILHMRIFFAFRAANKRRVQGMEGTPMANSPHIVSRARRKEVKLFKSLALMFAVFLLCFMPIQITNAVTHYRPDIKRSKEMTLSFVILQHSNSFIHPLVYAMGQVSIRRMIGVGVPPCFFRLCELKTSDSITYLEHGKTTVTHHRDETAPYNHGTMMESSSPAKHRFHPRRHTILWNDSNLDSSMTAESDRTSDEEHGSQSLPEPHA